MEKGHWEEFSRLQDEAVSRLRAGASRPGYTCEVQAFIMCSFDDNRVYELMYSERSALAVRTTWKRPIDVEKFINPLNRLKHGVGVRLQPTIEEIDANITMERLSELLFQAKGLSVNPYIKKDFIGLDGTNYELAFGNCFIRSRYQWWCDAPAEWTLLEALLKEIVELVDDEIAMVQG